MNNNEQKKTSPNLQKRAGTQEAKKSDLVARMLLSAKMMCSGSHVRSSKRGRQAGGKAVKCVYVFFCKQQNRKCFEQAIKNNEKQQNVKIRDA